MAGAEGLPDQSARIAALTELERSLLLEAGAGSGKTSIIAGRVAMLFARGIEPKRVAAITFTEFAASELMIRITHFVVALAKGEFPRDLEIAFPAGVSAEQRANLERAKKAAPLVGDDIAQSIREALLHQLRQDRMNERLFEKFVAALTQKIGCSEIKIISRGHDKGADIRAIHDALGVPIAVQVKYHNQLDHFARADRHALNERL